MKQILLKIIYFMIFCLYYILSIVGYFICKAADYLEEILDTMVSELW